MIQAKLQALLLEHDIEPTTESTVVVRPKQRLTKLWTKPTIPTQVSSNRVRVHAAHNREHDCYDSSTLYGGCTHYPWVTIILGSQVPIDATEYLYTLLGCALGHHYKAFQWLHLVCNVPTDVSSDVSVQITKGPLLCHVILRRVHSFTHSFSAKRIRRVHSTRSNDWYAKLASTTYYTRSYPCRLMVALLSWVVAARTGP
jgi:hypothetical protein